MRGTICCAGTNKGLVHWGSQKAFTRSAGSALEHAGINEVGSTCGPPAISAGAQQGRAATVSSSRCIRGFWIVATAVRSDDRVSLLRPPVAAFCRDEPYGAF